jgi:hypothetical protein
MKTIYLISKEDVIFGLKVIFIGIIVLPIYSLIEWLRKKAKEN